MEKGEETGTYWGISTWIEGEWNLEFIIDYGDSSRKIQDLEPFLWEGEEYSITSLVVSPFFIKAEILPTDKTISQKQQFNAVGRMTNILTKTDGTEVPLRKSWTSSEIEIIFSEIMPLEEMESIRFGDYTVKISP